MLRFRFVLFSPLSLRSHFSRPDLKQMRYSDNPHSLDVFSSATAQKKTVKEFSIAQIDEVRNAIPLPMTSNLLKHRISKNG